MRRMLLGSAATAIGLVAACSSDSPTAPCASGSVTFDYTGSPENLTLPGCVRRVTVEARGGAGGSGLADAPGGLGAMAKGDLKVQGGAVLIIMVGAKGANTSGGNAGVAGVFGGGGAGGTSVGGSGQPGGAAGGGASDVRLGGSALANRVIVAGGGGGGGGGCGGCGAAGGVGGGLIGADGESYSAGLGFEATGGTDTQGGANGSYVYAGAIEGTDGALGVGGDGDGNGFSGGGGGGGGYYGGGGGSTHFESGGGGGSSYLGNLTNESTQEGVNSGDGQVIISW